MSVMTSRSDTRHRPRAMTFVAAIVAALVAGTGSASAAKSPAGIVVENFHAALLDVMKRGPKLGFDGRYKVLTPVVKKSFALEFMARVSSGDYWKSMTAEQRKALIDTFTRVTIATYAGQFRKHSGQKFEMVEDAAAPRKLRSVLINLVKSNGDKVKLRYYLRNQGKDWRVVDIHLKGTISQLAVWIAEHSSVLRRSGYDGLIKALGDKITRMRNKGNAGE